MVGLVDGNNFFVSCERVVNPHLEGKAVAVLSNNDGCCVSRSNEFKAKGIAMGTPYFQLKDRERSGELIFCSSNYELYADLSARIMSILRCDAIDVIQYSIDEAFIFPPSVAIEDLTTWGIALRKKILKWVGIPCGIGFAPTKTLAKIANHIAKKTPYGVFTLPQDPTPILRELPIEEIWGIGKRYGAKFHAYGIHTAEQFRHLSTSELQSIGTINAVKTAMELNGQNAVAFRDENDAPDSITHSRSFGTPITSVADLMESIATFTAKAAEKLRHHRLFATGCNVYAQVGTSRDHTYLSKTVMFDNPTDATNEMLSAIRKQTTSLFSDGFHYRKSGIMFFGLEKAGSYQHVDLFTPFKPIQSSKLYKAIDSINSKFGAGKVFSAAEGFGKEHSWEMKRSKLSKRATTNWNELITVR